MSPGGTGPPPGARPARAVLLGGLAIAVLAAGAAALFLRERHPAIHVSGRVVGQDGVPLAGVRIALEITPAEDEEESPAATVSTDTDAEGAFSLDFLPASPECWYRLTAFKAGYAPAEIDPADPEAGPITITMSVASAVSSPSPVAK